MASSLELWFEYVLRFSHLVAGIAWIGSSFYFIWLDSAFLPPEKPRHNVDGEVFMVHGGFYYQVERKKIAPGELPKLLHWFKWEATLTWITGFMLLGFLYFLRGAGLLVDLQRNPISQAEAIGLCLGIIATSWLIYDLLIWNAKVIKSKAISVALSVVFFAGLIFELSHLFSGRGAFIVTGAIFGTMMLLNVWVRILPGQAKMLREAQAGQTPDYSVSLKSKIRSVHNTYFIFPVLFIMLSNHYPIVYNHKYNWLLLIALSVSGAIVRHTMVTKNPKERWLLAPAAVGLAALVFSTMPPKTDFILTVDQATLNAHAVLGLKNKIEYSEVDTVIRARCIACHSSSNSDDIYTTAPHGIMFESEEQFRARADAVNLHVVLAKSMPLGNKTKMTEDERKLISEWLRQEKLVQIP